MIKISTPGTTSLQYETIQNCGAVEGLDKEENSFYDSIKADLVKISKDPSTETINKILNYSKVL